VDHVTPCREKAGRGALPQVWFRIGAGTRLVNLQGATMADKHLRIYLNDHRAAARAGAALARRCQRSNEGTPLGDTIEDVAREIEDDVATLEHVAHALRIRIDPLKVATMRVGEVAGRLKLNGSVRRYSPLSRLLELEALLAGIDAKRSLWLSLHTAMPSGAAGVDFEAMAERATRQRDRLAPHHRAAAASAFGPRQPVHPADPARQPVHAAASRGDGA
jgi:hypothetical protein